MGSADDPPGQVPGAHPRDIRQRSGEQQPEGRHCPREAHQQGEDPPLVLGCDGRLEDCHDAAVGDGGEASDDKDGDDSRFLSRFNRLFLDRDIRR